MGNLMKIFLVIVASAYFGDAYRILVVFNFPGKSHSILAEGFERVLSDAGHEVTLITAFPRKNLPKNVKHIDVSYNQQVLPQNSINLRAILEKEVDPSDMTGFFHVLLDLGNSTFTNPNVHGLLNDPNVEFDLVIAEWMFAELAAGLSAVYGCPLVWFSSVEPHGTVLKLIDEDLNPSYNPVVVSTRIPPFSFIGRICELGSQLMISFVRPLFYNNHEAALYEEIFSPLVTKKGRTLPSYYEIIYNASLMFGNSHVSLGQATRLPQSYKPIAGYHIDPKLKPLPEDLKKLMESSKHGVIYFSMGSNLKSKDMPNEMKKDLLKMFGTLKYTVLWKFEEMLVDLPENVHIIQWAPQPSILAHPNCKLFITHGGLLSTTETMHYGVPIIGIPVFADQFANVDRAVNKGFAKRVDLSYSIAADLKVAIEDMVSSTSYLNRIKELSFVYKDRIATPAAEIVHWTEHVIKTHGAPHLRSPALLVPWYQKCYLDLAALVLIAIAALKVAIKRVFCRKKKTNTKTKTN